MSLQPIIQAEKNTNAGVIKDWCHTRQQTKTFQFAWTIYQFSTRREATGQHFESSVFPAGLEEPKWILRAYPHGCEERFKEYLGIAIFLHRGRNVSAQVECSIAGDKNKKLITRGSGTFAFEQGGYLHFPDFINFHELLRSGASLLPQNKLTILCEVLVIYKTFNISGQTNAGKFIVPENTLSEDLGALHDSERFSDVKLIADGHELKAHKAILSARSKVFAAMFHHPMREQISDSVAISDIHHEVLREMLNYMYTDKAANLNTMVAELLAVSDKYEITNLKVMCEECLRSNLNVDNAAMTLILADRHNANELKAETLKYIVGNAKAIVRTTGWEDLKTSHVALVAEAFCAFAEAQLLMDEEMTIKNDKK